MNRIITTIVSLLIVGVGVAAVALMGRKPGVAEKEGGADSTVLVNTVPAVSWTDGFSLVVDGEASSRRVVSIGSEVEGRILRRRKRSGNFVEVGDLLYEVDSTKYVLDVRRLQAQLSQATAELDAIDIDLRNTMALLELAQRDAAIQSRQVQRMETLRAKGATDDVTVEAAQVRELTAHNTVQTLKNSISTFEQQKKTKSAALELVAAQLERAQLDVKRCQIRATVAGRIADDTVEEGDFVKQGQILVRISDRSQMEVKCFLKPDDAFAVFKQQNRTDLVPTRDDEWFRLMNLFAYSNLVPVSSPLSVSTAPFWMVPAPDHSGDPVSFPRIPCSVSFEVDGVESEWLAFIDRLEGTGIDRQTRTVPCRILVPFPNQLINEPSQDPTQMRLASLLSGMFVKVRLPLEAGPLVQIPLSAIRQGNNVWVRRKDKLKILPVRIVHIDGDRAFIEEGLVDAGDRVVVSPLVSVVNEMEVKEDTREATQ